MSNPGKVKLFQAASGQTGSSWAAAGGANVSFTDALQEANASTSHSFSNNSTHASGYSSGHTKTGQGEELKKSSTKNGAAEGQSGAQAGPQVIQQAGKQAGTDAASQAGEGGQSGLAGTKKLSSKVDVDGSKDDLRAQTKDNGASQSSGQTASKGSLDADIAGIIGSLVARGSLKASNGGETKMASSSLSGTDTSGTAKAAGADAMSGPYAVKKSGSASGQKNTKKTLADALQATGVSHGAVTASGVDKKDGKSGQLADSLVSGTKGGSSRAGALAGAINSATGSVPESDQSGQSARVADKSKAGESGTDESGSVSGKSSTKAPLSDPGKTDGNKLFAQAQVDDGKDKFSGDLKTKVDESMKIKGLEGLGDKAAPGGQEESSHSQNGLSGSRPDNTSNNLSAQDLLKAGAQESGAGHNSGGSGAAPGKFIPAQVIADAKNIQAGVLKDGDKGKGQAIDGRSIQTPDKSVSVSTGNSNPANIISGRTQTETVRTPHPVEEPFVVTKQADNSIEVRIEPEGLGKMDIKLYMDKGQLNAHINASESIGKEVIEGHLENIANKLAGEGINIGSFSVSLRNRKNGGQREFFPGNGDRSGDKTRTMHIEQIGQKPAVAGGGLLSLFA